MSDLIEQDTDSSPEDPTTRVPSMDTGGSNGKLQQPVRLAILAASVVAGVGLVMALWSWNVLAVVIVSAVIYSVAIYAVSRALEGPRHATDRLVTATVTTMFLLALIPLVSVIWSITSRGLARFDAAFFTYSMSGVGVGETGGAYHALIGSLIVTAMAGLISIPVGIFAAIYLVEYGGGSRVARALTFFVDVMTGIPSIVAGLFAISLFTLLIGPAYQAGIVGAVALSVLMIPVVVRSTEEMLRLVPNELREASYALGVPKWLTISKVVLPTAIAGIATGVTLAIARVMGETAPLLLTMGAAKSANFNPFEGSMSALPLFAYSSYTNPGTNRQDSIDAAWTAALTLLIIVMLLNLVARLISKFFAPKTGR